MARLFISQERIDYWTSVDKVNVEGDRMVLPAFGTTFKLVSAVHFVRAVDDGDGGATDVLELVGRVKTEEQLRRMGAELVANSVLVGDLAYECETGFVGEVLEAGAAGVEGQAADKVVARQLRQADLRQLSD